MATKHSTPALRIDPEIVLVLTPTGLAAAYVALCVTFVATGVYAVLAVAELGGGSVAAVLLVMALFLVVGTAPTLAGLALRSLPVEVEYPDIEGTVRSAR